MHKFVINNCRIECRIDGKNLSPVGEAVTFEDAEYFGVADGRILLTTKGKDYSCSVSDISVASLDKRKGAESADVLTLISGGEPFITASNVGHKFRFRLLEYIFDYITAYDFDVDVKARTAARLDGKYHVKSLDGITCTYYVDKKGELSDSNSGKRRESECTLTTEGGLTVNLAKPQMAITVDTDDILSLIADKAREYRYATVSVCVKKRSGLFFSLHAFGGDKSRALECSAIDALGDGFRLDRRENCLFHRKEKRRK